MHDLSSEKQLLLSEVGVIPLCLPRDVQGIVPSHTIPQTCVQLHHIFSSRSH